MTEGFAFTLGGAALLALPSGALWWAAQRTLIVADLHFGKAERLARRGGALLPPYESRDTLLRLDTDISKMDALTVICLGDSFDDAEAVLGPDELSWLTRLMAGRTWIWIAGNHDPAPLDVGGTHLAQMEIEGLALRHIATGIGTEVSGHYHPKAKLAGTARPAFLIDGRHVIMPAYGTYTGGLWCTDPALLPLMGPDALAVLTGQRTIVVPVHTKTALPRKRRA
ncbi:ligase-associated DNA damage response endonuclease PdeM [Falsirhodobacter sp. alg1]|uniref:ligase-associated DNA damage response endonuclease PdeM n=1 Tax=Falsirhodobacter sp. alg1 TaxID=1472418 RepID=UPI0005ED62CA|nr:ligase-associated DNA damage response endonuclease PdeM [Falsirhodobacter sp. alg1]